MAGTMNCSADLNNFNNMGIVTADVQTAAEAWARIFEFKLPHIVDASKGWPGMDKSGILDTYPTLYRGNKWTDGGIKQYNVVQKKYAFEVKEPGKHDAQREFLDAFGNGVCYLAYEAKENRNQLVQHLISDYGCEMLHYMKYQEPYRGDWCTMDTLDLLGVVLVIKADGYSEYRTFPLMDDFREFTVVVPDLKKAVRNWGDVFAIPYPKIRTIETEVEYKGEKSVRTVKAAEITEGAYIIHLVEAGEQGPFADFGASRAPGGVFHVSMEMEPEEQADMIEKFRSVIGKGILCEFDLFGRHYRVFDSLDILGINFAMYW